MWRDRFRLAGEASPEDSFRRVTGAVYAADERRADADASALATMLDGRFCPGESIFARIGGTPTPLAASGTKSATKGLRLAVEEQPVAVLEALEAAVARLGKGGDVTMNLTPLPPAGARTDGTDRLDAGASGVLPVLDHWEGLARRLLGKCPDGPTQMTATLSCDHPDLPAFVALRSEAGRLCRLKLSVLVSDAFLEAVDSNEDWELGHAVPPVDPGTRTIVRQGRDRSHWHVYQVVSARALWEEILRHCDGDGETAVIFSDRGSEEASAAETAADNSRFSAPTWGTLARGSVNLGALVAEPFGPQARVDEDALRQVTTAAIRFLDNTVDCLAAAQDPIGFEGLAERRVALGVMGLNTMLQKLGMAYGSSEALRETRRIARLLRDAAYAASISLAKERGSFPAFDPERYGARDDVQSLPERLRRGIRDHGIRNAALLGVPVEEASACFLRSGDAGYRTGTRVAS